MKFKSIFIWLVLLSIIAPGYLLGQTKTGKVISVAVTNNHSAYPFSKFADLFTKEIHPGIEFGYGFNWATKKKHDWYQAIKVGYFYHRFAQHAIPLYSQAGYRYKLKKHWRFETALGAGYLHSIPDATVLKLNDEGIYENVKGIGRGQLLINFSLGAQYELNANKRSPKIFFHYMQQLQTPFIKSYVPILPYNSIALGLAIGLKK